VRTVLYLSPYFPPMTRVGALRPLKFVRHLGRHGWRAVVLCDLRPGDERDPDLLRAVPEGTVVVRDYGRRARSAERVAPRPSHSTRLPRFLDNPELVPLGEHALDLPHALRAGRALVREHRPDVILVNADPFAATLVGARLSRESGVPLVLDLRDPWALCELRRPMRPAPSRFLVDRLERRAVAAARVVSLNTERARSDYRTHYRDLPPERFAMIRNHSDAELVSHGEHPGFDRFTLLHLGGFRRFISGDVLLDLLEELHHRGVDAQRLQLVVTGSCPEQTLAEARRRGVQDMLRLHRHVPYLQLGPALAAADLLVTLLNPRTVQRLPTKLYDYATSRRPILAFGENPELFDLCDRLGGARCFHLNEVSRAADLVAEEVGRGRGRDVAHGGVDLSTAAATERLAELLTTAADPTRRDS
jgi:hypothetical protein